ncbi:fatty-acid-binding protein 3, chloroplastic isoform X2 [Euphorbia lathyris]|uniref:fatty-acid-binding protein 3, chloroplastic isoform X2 n=1 Tax=Euphorbia lathyris TaxID=212925 RepID=UPI0033133300
MQVATISSTLVSPNSTLNFSCESPHLLMPFCKTNSFSPLSSFPSFRNHHPVYLTHLNFKASSSSSSPVGSTDYVEEPTTKVKFLTSLSLPGCSSSLALLGTGYREKVFAIIGVKVYAAGLYANESMLSTLTCWKGKSASELQQNPALFSTIFQVSANAASAEKSLQIVLVRDVDGKTFWDALDDAVSPRIEGPTPVDESALSTFRSIFEGQPLKKGTFIFLTWLDSSRMLICISSDGMPSSVDATIESKNVSFALFDVFFGDATVSPSLKASVSHGIATYLK